MEKIDIIRRALDDWSDGKLSDHSFIYIVHMVIDDVPSQKQLEKYSKRIKTMIEIGEIE